MNGWQLLIRHQAFYAFNNDDRVVNQYANGSNMEDKVKRLKTEEAIWPLWCPGELWHYDSGSQWFLLVSLESRSLIDWGVRESLLRRHGDVKDVIKKGLVFKGSSSTLCPIKPVRHAGHGPWEDTARITLAFSKMNLTKKPFMILRRWQWVMPNYLYWS